MQLNWTHVLSPSGMNLGFLSSPAFRRPPTCAFLNRCIPAKQGMLGWRELLGGRFNTLRPRQNDRHFADHIFNTFSSMEMFVLRFKMSLNFVPRGLINNIAALVQITAWRRPGDKPLSEPMMVRLPTHICVTRPQWHVLYPTVQVIDHRTSHYLQYIWFMIRYRNYGPSNLRHMKNLIDSWGKHSVTFHY